MNIRGSHTSRSRGTYRLRVMSYSNILFSIVVE